MKKFVLMGLAALAVSGAWAITATKEYVDRSTNATLVASKAYTDAAMGAVTNIAGTVTSNVVTKAYVEGLGIEAGINESTATNISYSVVSNSVNDGYICTIAAAQAMTNAGAVAYADAKFRTLTDNVCHSDAFGEWEIISKTEGMAIVFGPEYYGGRWNIEVYYDDDFHMLEAHPAEGESAMYIYARTQDDIWWCKYKRNKTSTSGRHFVTYDNMPSTNGLVTASGATNIAEGVNASTRAIVETWEGFLGGSNVVFSITNYISGTYNLNTAKLKILEMRNGQYQDVYNSRDEILLHLDGFRTNEFVVATNAIVSGVDAKIADKADRAWGKHTSSGGVAPSNTVYMTAPSTVFAGGLEYERVAVGEGMVGILTTKGAPTYTTGDEGTFKFQDDGGTNYFGFAKTDSYVIGCDTDAISVQNHIVTLTYNVTMSGVPCVWYCPTLDVLPLVWEQLNTPDGQPIAGASHTVTWDASPAAGTEVCYLNCPEAKGFFKATVEVAGSAKFMTNMPADLMGGIMCTNTATGVTGIIRPAFNGSTVTWSWSNL